MDGDKAIVENGGNADAPTTGHGSGECDAPTTEQRLSALEAEVSSLRDSVMYLHHGTGLPPGTTVAPESTEAEQE